MNFHIEICHRRNKNRLIQKYGEEYVYDLTSKGTSPWVRFSPFYPHNNIPVPGWEGMCAVSVEGIWQGLKRFEHEDEIDLSVLTNRTMRNIKRTSRAKGRYGLQRGKVLGHQLGNHSDILLDYYMARMIIYLPSYLWVLQNKLQQEIELLRNVASEHSIFLLDYEINLDYANILKPLSHCSLVRHYLYGAWPVMEIDDLWFSGILRSTQL